MPVYSRVVSGWGVPSVESDPDTFTHRAQMSSSLGPDGVDATIELSSHGQIKNLIKGGLGGDDQGGWFSISCLTQFNDDRAAPRTCRRVSVGAFEDH